MWVDQLFGKHSGPIPYFCWCLILKTWLLICDFFFIIESERSFTIQQQLVKLGVTELVFRSWLLSQQSNLLIKLTALFCQFMRTLECALLLLNQMYFSTCGITVHSRLLGTRMFPTSNLEEWTTREWSQKSLNWGVETLHCARVLTLVALSWQKTLSSP